MILIRITPIYVIYFSGNNIHVIGVIRSKNDTLFSKVVKPEVQRIFNKYGGHKKADSTLAWQQFSGTSWPPEDSDWMFYGPMPYRNNFTNIITSRKLE